MSGLIKDKKNYRSRGGLAASFDKSSGRAEVSSGQDQYDDDYKPETHMRRAASDMSRIDERENSGDQLESLPTTRRERPNSGDFLQEKAQQLAATDFAYSPMI